MLRDTELFISADLNVGIEVVATCKNETFKLMKWHVSNEKIEWHYWIFVATC